MEARTHSTRAAKFTQCQCLLNVCDSVCVSQKNCDEGEMKMYVLNNANVFVFGPAAGSGARGVQRGKSEKNFR
jgi:hypothetical protein